MRRLADKILNFNIDTYINPYIPRSRLGLLPKPISWFLGYREEPPKECNNLLRWIWAFIGAFVGLILVEVTLRCIHEVRVNGGPVIIGCFGATAIIQFHLPEAPVSQPRAMIISQIFAGVIGVGITKLFALLPVESFDNLRWLVGALTVALTSFVMGVTNTVHPPAGAAALLAAVTADVTSLGWWLIPLLQLGNAMMLLTTLITMNIHRRYPSFWWTPANLTRSKPVDSQKATPLPEYDSSPSSINDAHHLEKPANQEHPLHDYDEHSYEIRISNRGVVLPPGLELDDFEKSILEVIRWKLPEAV